MTTKGNIRQLLVLLHKLHHFKIIYIRLTSGTCVEPMLETIGLLHASFYCLCSQDIATRRLATSYTFFPLFTSTHLHFATRIIDCLCLLFAKVLWPTEPANIHIYIYIYIYLQHYDSSFMNAPHPLYFCSDLSFPYFLYVVLFRIVIPVWIKYSRRGTIQSILRNSPYLSIDTRNNSSSNNNNANTTIEQ